MAALTVKQMTLGDADPELAAASAGGDSAPVAAGNLLLVLNSDSSSHTATVALNNVPANDFYASAATSLDFVVAADDVAVIPLSHKYLDDGTDGAAITYDAVTSVKVALIK